MSNFYLYYNDVLGVIADTNTNDSRRRELLLALE
jgi:hypothetical protein